MSSISKENWGTLYDRYKDNGKPRKILSLDGGGMRGVITLEILKDMEQKLKKELKEGDDFVLSDYFDYIGGTSTGAIIAAGLSRGMHVQQLLDFYIGKTYSGPADNWKSGRSNTSECSQTFC